MIKHPENALSIPPSSDGFFFCLWEAIRADMGVVYGDEVGLENVTARYRLARAGQLPCPLAETCETRAHHLARISNRQTSTAWATLTKSERKRLSNKAQDLMFEAERHIGAYVVGPMIKTWLESNTGTLLGVKMRRLLDSHTVQLHDQLLLF